jgi:hypothetical protein
MAGLVVYSVTSSPSPSVLVALHVALANLFLVQHARLLFG